MERVDAKVFAKHWRWEKDPDGLVWLTFDKQGESANTFSRGALNELSVVLEEIAAARPKGLVIGSAKEGFIAGVDIEELTRLNSGAEALELTRLGWDVLQKLRDLPFPTTALINGFCMGGGTELSLACRYRVALDDPKVRIALPEVMLGIMPVWHGVQWLPKLVGPGPAFDMLLTGKSLDAKRAKRIGLVDQAVPLRILENTARMVTLEDRGRRQPPLLQQLMLSMRGLVVAQARKQVAKKAKREHLSRALRDPRALAVVRRRSVRRGEGPVVLDRVAHHPPDRPQPDPHLLPAGAVERPGQSRGLHAAARSHRRRRRDGRRHRGDLRHAWAARDASGHRARAHRAGGEARRGALQAPAARCAARA
jgi:enoyl-CoA hydratase/carnithine racemase